MPSFNLTDQPWIPCIGIDGVPCELSLHDTLVQAPQLREMFDSSPVITAGMYRLLLAILHRVIGPKDERHWGESWQQGAWDTAVVEAYLDEWRPRFDLFAEHRPFYQVADLDFQYAVPTSKLAHELASGNNATLFDHTTDDLAPWLTPAQAARCLVGLQPFAIGGLVSFERGQNRSIYGSAKNGLLTKGSVVIVKGKNLFETLMLNLHKYNAADGEPFDFVAENDKPAWEKDREPQAEGRVPAGYLDLLTWQSRRVRLHPELDEHGAVGVREAVIMKGEQLPAGVDGHGRETSIAFRKNQRPAAGMEPWQPLAFQEERVVWRDSPVLFQSLAEQHDRPKILDWLSDLAENGEVPRSTVFPMDMYGLCADRAKVLLWRHERLPLPLAYLKEEDLVAALKDALSKAEETARVLDQTVRYLATLIFIPDADQLEAKPRQDKERLRKDDINGLAKSLGASRSYWARLEPPFRYLLVALPQDQGVVDGKVAYGVLRLPEWRETLRTHAEQVFGTVTASLDASPRVLKAVALAQPRFAARLTRALGPHPAAGQPVA